MNTPSIPGPGGPRYASRAHRHPPRTYTLAEVAEMLGIDLDELDELNDEVDHRSNDGNDAP